MKLILAALLAITAATAQTEGLALLKQPGTAAIMRHALAPGGGDPSNFMLGDCATQRNLDDRGREQAPRIGAALRKAGVEFDQVLTNAWCRCEETAALLDLGAPEVFAPLNSFFQNRGDGPAQTDALKAFLADLPRDETVMLVTHQVNITALTGEWVDSGEIFILEIAEDGAARVIDRVLIDP